MGEVMWVLHEPCQVWLQIAGCVFLAGTQNGPVYQIRDAGMMAVDHHSTAAFKWKHRHHLGIFSLSKKSAAHSTPSATSAYFETGFETWGSGNLQRDSPAREKKSSENSNMMTTQGTSKACGTENILSCFFLYNLQEKQKQTWSQVMMRGLIVSGSSTAEY